MQHPDSMADARREDLWGASGEVQQQTHKRLTLNLLIQGAAAHTFLTAHHLVRDDLEAIRPGLTELYDRAAVSLFLNYWIGDVALLNEMPSRFWGRIHREGHPFRGHRLLATHGGELSKASKLFLLSRGRQKRVVGIPIIHFVQMLCFVVRVACAERGKKAALAELAKRAAAQIWGIEQGRLDAAITTDVRFGNLTEPRTPRGRLLQQGAIGWGGVQRRDGKFRVVARAWNWPLVLHELTKGTAELICLHGLNSLNDETYRAVVDEADQIEYENWLMQAGQEAWRRLLAVLPHEQPLASVLMHIARLEPLPLERLMLAVIEHPEEARKTLAEFPRQAKRASDETPPES